MTTSAMTRPERDAPNPADTPAATGAGTGPRSFRAIVLEHGPHLQRVLRSLGVREADLDDVCQETFIVAHRRLATFEGRSTLRTWLCGIALRVASDYRKKAYHRRELPGVATPERAQAASQEQQLERKRAWALIERLLSELSADQREIFVLYEIGELSVPEAATVLGCPVQTAYSRLHAARHQMQRLAQAQQDRPAAPRGQEEAP